MTRFCYLDWGGCSLGREGPTVHIAGALASNIAGWLGIAKQAPALLSGAAAGLAAAFQYTVVGHHLCP